MVGAKIRSLGTNVIATRLERAVTTVSLAIFAVWKVRLFEKSHNTFSELRAYHTFVFDSSSEFLLPQERP